MADDNNARYRSDDSLGRGPAQAAPANDPLAELARLIGRNDPFAEYAREPQPTAQPDPGAGYGEIPAPQYTDPAPQYVEPAPRYSEPAPRYSEPAQHYTEPPRYSDPAQQYGQDYSQPAAPRYAAEHSLRAIEEQLAQGWPGLPAPPPSYQPSESYAQQQPNAYPPPTPRYDTQSQARQSYPNQDYGSALYTDPQGWPASRPPEHPSFNAGLPAPPDRQGYAPPLYPHEPEAGSMPAPHDDEFYDDEPRGGRRKGLLTVVAVLGLAVIGTAGAFGYRSIFGSSGSSGPPPVIRASGEPSKVAPPPATPDTSASKFSYDRFGDAGKDEQVVRREEKPVDLRSAPRTVFPGAPVPTPPSVKSSTGSTNGPANPPSAIGEPRRVRTVPIRPDQGGDVAATPPSQQPSSVAPPRQINPASTRVAARSAPPQPAAVAQAPVANAPLSLSPDANNNALPPPPAQDAFPPPPAPRASAPPPARVASAPASAPASGGGSYLVQVSSQKSEADAQTAYRGIQSKYSSVLGSQPHTVRRADLGAKGVYYRAMVGPFASRDQAVQLCSSLKQAGGDCVVQH